MGKLRAPYLPSPLAILCRPQESSPTGSKFLTMGALGQALFHPQEEDASLPCATGIYITLAVFSYLAFSRPYYLTRQKHPALTAGLPQQQVLVLAKPKQKPSTFWHSISRLAPFRK